MYVCLTTAALPMYADDLLVFEDQLIAVAALGRHSPEHSLSMLTSLLRDAVAKFGSLHSTEEVCCVSVIKPKWC